MGAALKAQGRRWLPTCRSLAAGSRAALALVLVAGWLAGVAVVRAQEAKPQATDAKPLPSVVLIFDGSGSMWGRIEGEKQIKLALARDGVKAALAKVLPLSVQLGLMSFGHRRQADCSDVQVISPPESLRADELNERILSPIEKLNPKGKGPLTTALREAAKLLANASGPRSIVLIHDDPDNCQQDPCAALADIQQSAPGVVVHVVGLGLKPEDATRYQCLTKPTGGLHVDAQDAARIANGIGEVLQAATLGATALAANKLAPQLASAATKAAPAAPPAVLVAPAAPPVDLSRAGPPAIRLHALVGKDRQAAGVLVRWSVAAEQAKADAPPLAEIDGVDATLPMPPGTYKVHAVSGLVQGDTTVTVGAQGQALAQVAFDAGEIRIKAPLAADATVIVAERLPQQPAAAPGVRTTPPATLLGRRLGVWPHGETRLLVPARPLALSLEQAELRSLWPIDITPGEVKEIDVGQAGGRLILDLQSGVGGGPAPGMAFANQPVVFVVEEDDPDAPHGRREIARSAAPVAEFVVSPGTYIVSAIRGPLLTRERVGVVAGEVVRRSLPLAAARLVLGARLGKVAASSSERPRDSFVVTPLDGDRATSFQLAGPAAVLDVPPGRYRVEARRNNAAIRSEQVVEIRAGEYKLVTLEYQAGAIRLDMTQSVAAGDPVAWRIVDAEGRLVDSGDETVSTALLPVGRYTLKADSRGRRREVPLDIKVGEINSLRLP